MRFGTGRRKPPKLHISDPSLTDTRFNFQSGLVQAVWLLQMKGSFYRPTWNAVLDALARNASYKVIHLADVHNGITFNQTKMPDLHFNAILAYRLMQQVLEDYQDHYLAPDPLAFLAICRATENLGIACWSIFSNDHYPGQTSADTFGNADETSFMPTRVSEAKDVLAYDMPQRQVRHYFKLLVGDTLSSKSGRNLTLPERELSGAQSASSPGLPRLLAIPSPAILHAYIRALGWCGAHDSILEALKWMVEYQAELAEAAPRARNSANVTRRAVVAARVFLERSWLSSKLDAFASREAAVYEDALSGEVSSKGGQVGEKTSGKPALLQMFESPASAEQIEQARALIESVPDWGGWATEEEVEAYCQNGRFT
jgi:hypothetical protein